MKTHKTPENFFGTFNDAIERLNRDVGLHIKHPVSIRRRKLRSDAGSCFLNKHKTRFTITVDSRLSVDAAILVLIHEYAHALDWDNLRDGNKNKRGTGKNMKKKSETEDWDHSATWGKWYAACLRSFDRVD